MKCINYINKKYFRTLSLVLVLGLLISSFKVYAGTEIETPEEVYSGINNAAALLKNMQYTDLKASEDWAKETIYQFTALNIIKNFNSKTFNINGKVTKEDAIAFAYRAAGREAEAQLEAEKLYSKSSGQAPRTNTLEYWADGYLQLAAKDGLITKQNLNDAFAANQKALPKTAFHRKDPAQRQELAYWLAKTLKLTPVYSQQKILNRYKDWKQIDPAKVPFVEPIILNNLMNGNGKDIFNPKVAVTNSQLVWILKNGEDVFLSALTLEKKRGIIGDIARVKDETWDRRALSIRNSNEKLHIINIEVPVGTGTIPASINKDRKELLVYKGLKVAKNSPLKKGDRIEYIVSPDKTVKFVKVLTNINDTKFVAVQVNEIDPAGLTMEATKLFGLDYPDTDISKNNIFFDINDGDTEGTFYINKNALVYIGGSKASVNKLVPGSYVILTVNNGIVDEIKTFKFDERNINYVVRGIVEDNNPLLGYITLYNEDGSSSGPYDFRTYNYSSNDLVKVYKNGKEADINDIEAGDTAFIKLDGKGAITSISAIDNYTVKYARVMSKRPGSIVVEYDSEVQQVLDIDDSVMFISEKKLVSYKSLKDGDRVKLILHITDSFTKVREVTIEGNEHHIVNIYKAKVSYIDDTSNELVGQNFEVLSNGNWARTDKKGVASIKLSDRYKLYYDSKSTDITGVNRYLRGKEAYIAVVKDFDGTERAVVTTFRNENDAEDVPYDDSITAAPLGTDEISLQKQDEKIKLDEGTIVVKYGRLVSGNSISAGDPVYVVANRSYDTGGYYAGIVQVSERADIGFAEVYRARITQIDENKSFTVGSFSQLNGLSWEYSNTPKTFRLTYETRIVDEDGLLNQRDFADYGEESYKDRTVYIVAKGTDALLVSTAPYGIYNAKGEVYDVAGGEIGEEGTVTKEPDEIKLKDAAVYDPDTFMWADSNEMALKVLPNTIIFKNNAIAKPSDIKAGESIRVLKKDNSTEGDAYIIIVEG